MPEPGYPVYERGALFAGAEVETFPLLEAHGFLPDLDAIDDDTWPRTALSGSTTRTTRPARSPRSRSTSGSRSSRASTTSSLCLRRGVHRALVRRAARLRAAGARPLERRRLQHALEALVDDRLPLRLRRRRRPSVIASLRKFRPNVGTAPQEFVQRASSGRLGRRGARRAEPGALRAQAAALPRRVRAAGVALAGERRDDVPLGRGARRGDVRSVRGAAARARRRRHAGVVLRPVGRGLRPLRARSDRGRSAPSGARSRRSSEPEREIDALWDELDPSRADAVEETIAALDRGELRVAEKRDGEWVVNEWVKKAILLYFRLRQMEPVEVGPFEYHDKIPLKRDYAERGVRVVPPATARYGSFLSPGVDADAELREHRRLGRPAHDGGHLGHRRLVRADRRGRAPRRAASASAACSSRRARAR